MTNEVVAKKRKPNEYLTDDEAFAVIKRAVNQRKDSIEQFEKASRNDLVGPEKAELVILESYLPAQMSREEIMTIAKAKMTVNSASLQSRRREIYRRPYERA